MEAKKRLPFGERVEAQRADMKRLGRILRQRRADRAEAIKQAALNDLQVLEHAAELDALKKKSRG